MLASNFMSNEKNSSLFTQLLSSAKGVLLTLFGYLILQDFSATPKTLFGMFLSVLGSVLITVKSITQGYKKKENVNIESNGNKIEMTGK